MLSSLYIFIITGFARKIVLMAHTEQPRSKAVNYNLKLVGYNPNSVKFLWALDFNYSRFRFREGEFYLTKDSTDRLVKKSGGNELLKYSQDAELNEFKQLIKGSSGSDNANSGGVRRDGSTLLDDDRGGASKSSGFQSDYKDAFVPANKKRSRYSSYLINESTNASFLNSFNDKENSETRESAFSSFDKRPVDKKTKSNISENASKKLKSEGDSTVKSDLIDQNDQDSTNSLLSENIQSNAYPTNKPISPSNDIGPDDGYVFDIIPIFNHKLDKKSLVIKDRMCLTHTLLFKACDYDSFWDLPEEYYWDIYGAEDQVYLNKIKSFLERKVKNGDKILQNQFAELKGCPNACPDGNCEQNYDDEDEDSTCPRKSQSKVDSEKNRPNQDPLRYANTNNMPMTYNQPMVNLTTNPNINPLMRINSPQVSQPRTNVLLPVQPIVYPEMNGKNFRPQPMVNNQGRSDQVLVDRKTLDNLLNYALNRTG